MLTPSPAPAQSLSPSRLSAPVFAAVQDFAYRIAGIDLQSGKQEMVASRLWKRARALDYPTSEAYFNAVLAQPGGELELDLIDALTTNHTGFFREPAHFDFLRKKILPALRDRSSFRIWTAASSTGEEPYSIAITLREELGENAGRIANIKASDISTRVLARAGAGVYAEERVREQSADWKRKYLLRGTGPQSGNYRIRPEIRQMVHFERINLMEPLPAEGPFPLIFLRNIMIYFDRPTQQRLVQALTAKLDPGGYLFIGHSESLNGIEHTLELVQVAIYRRPLIGGAK